MKGARVALGAVLVVAVGVGVYFALVRGPGGARSADPLASRREECGNGDPAAGGDPRACLQYAYDLMGRANVTPDDDAARSILKRSCDHAFQEACDALADFASARADIAEGRCDGAWYPAVARGCIDAGRAHEEGTGRTPRWTEARRWYEKACKLGDQEGCERMESVAPR